MTRVGVRISGGSARGRRLHSSASGGARPTSARVRGAIFSMVEARGLEGAVVLDLFAGTGSLGLEALSRGASHADFVERDPRQCRVLRTNLAATGFTSQAQVYCAPVERALTFLKGPYRFIFMDPPYKLLDLDAMLGTLAAAHILTPGGVAVVGHSKRLSLRERYGDLVHVGLYRYGDSVVDLLQREAQ
ncbi:MAG: 16S rRNA (guanine(966)-N(2))-methyltransferase RsmD [Dehalococcoidia bacterium]